MAGEFQHPPGVGTDIFNQLMKTAMVVPQTSGLMNVLQGKPPGLAPLSDRLNLISMSAPPGIGDVADLGVAGVDTARYLTGDPEIGLGTLGLDALAALPFVGAGTKSIVGKGSKFAGKITEAAKKARPTSSRRKMLEGLVKDNANHRYWYERMKDFLYRGANGDPQAENLLAHIIAATSARATVESNASLAAKAATQAAVGHPISGLKNGANKIVQFMVDNPSLVEDIGGPKTGNFVNNLLNKSELPTVDMWIAKAFGLDPEKLTIGQHRMIWNELEKMAKKANKEKWGGMGDWTPKRVQAAMWVGMKKAEGGNTGEIDMAKAFMDRMADVTYELRPGAATGELGGKAVEPYLDELQKLNPFISPTGGDEVAHAITGGLLPSVDSKPVRGIYRNAEGQMEFNPGTSFKELISQASGNLSPESRTVLDNQEALRSYLTAQEGGGWNALMTKNTTKRAMTGLDLEKAVKKGRMSPDQAREILTWAEQKFPGRKPVIADVGDSVRVWFPMEDNPTPFKPKEVQELAKDLPKPLTKAERVKIESNYIPVALDAETDAPIWGGGRATKQLLERFDTPEGRVMAERIDKSKRLQTRVKRWLRDVRAFAKRHNLPMSEEWQNALDLFSKGGMKKLREGLEKDIPLPAIIFMSLGLKQAPWDANKRQTSSQ